MANKERKKNENDKKNVSVQYTFNKTATFSDRTATCLPVSHWICWTPRDTKVAEDFEEGAPEGRGDAASLPAGKRHRDASTVFVLLLQLPKGGDKSSKLQL